MIDGCLRDISVRDSSQPSPLPTPSSTAPPLPRPPSGVKYLNLLNDLLIDISILRTSQMYGCRSAFICDGWCIGINWLTDFSILIVCIAGKAMSKTHSLVLRYNTLKT